MIFHITLQFVYITYAKIMSIHFRFCLKGATPLIFVISTWFLEVLIFFAKQHVDLITDHDIFLEADFN